MKNIKLKLKLLKRRIKRLDSIKDKFNKGSYTNLNLLEINQIISWINKNIANSNYKSIFVLLCHKYNIILDILISHFRKQIFDKLLFLDNQGDLIDILSGLLTTLSDENFTNLKKHQNKFFELLFLYDPIEDDSDPNNGNNLSYSDVTIISNFLKYLDFNDDSDLKNNLYKLTNKKNVDLEEFRNINL